MAHPVDVHVGRRLRLKRTILGFSQEMVGKAIGVTFQQVQKYERGVNRMSASRLFEFAQLLKVPIVYFFDGYQEHKDDALPADEHETFIGLAENNTDSFEYEQLASRETLEMMRAYYRITDPAVRKRVFELVKSLATESE